MEDRGLGFVVCVGGSARPRRSGRGVTRRVRVGRPGAGPRIRVLRGAASSVNNASNADSADDAGSAGDGDEGGNGGDDGNHGHPHDGQFNPEDGGGHHHGNPLERLVTTVFGTISGALSAIGNTLKDAPLQGVVAVTAVFTALINNLFNRYSQDLKRQREMQDEARKRLEAKRDELTKSYKQYAEPLLKAAAKLQDYLYMASSASEDVLFPVHSLEADSKYAAYLFARYMCFVELFKRVSPTMDFGRPRNDRVFSNILGRIQVVLAMHENELGRDFNHGETPINSLDCDCPSMQLSSYDQAAIGELMMRDRWSKFNFKSGNAVSTDPGLHYLEFQELLNSNSEFQKFLGPIVKANESLFETQNAKVFSTARMALLQGSLVDLIDFLDPAPRCAIIPPFRRKRMRMKPGVYNAPLPRTLERIYQAESAARDGTLPLPFDNTAVDLFVSGPTGLGSSVNVPKDNSVGDCPYSHRVLLTLEEKRVDYNLITIDRAMRPHWYWIVHPEAKVPVLSHDGTLIEDSAYIVTYLEQKFPKKLKARVAKRPGDPFPAIDTFRANFMGYIRNKDTEPEFMASLDTLETTVGGFIQPRQGPFFGGKKLAREDVTLMPFLHHMEVVGEELRGWKLPADRYPALTAYIKSMKHYPSFKKTAGTKDAILYGYRDLKRGVLHDWVRHSSDILE